jgi:phosphoribosylformylglycinamidine cyclo-ligase
MADIVGGIAEGCRLARCALVGGETAEHPGMMEPDAYDLAATGVGIVEADEVLSSELVRAGDVVIAMASSGVHSNGFSLVRHVLLGAGRMRLDAHIDDYEMPLGEVLLTPTRIYAQDCLALMAEVEVHSFSHITGGGLASNIARVVPTGLVAVLDRSTWAVPPIFRLVAERGRVEQDEMERTFNQGVGMVAIVDAADADRSLAVLAHRHIHAWVAGIVESGAGGARLEGRHPA